MAARKKTLSKKTARKKILGKKVMKKARGGYSLADPLPSAEIFESVAQATADLLASAKRKAQRGAVIVDTPQQGR